MSAEQVLERVSGSDPVWSVIWLHGLGADNTDFQDLPRLLQLPPNVAVRFLFPNAPKRPITLNGGVVMRGWYDIDGLDMARRVDEDGLKDASSRVVALIDQEKARGIGAHQIFVGGFSQGGAVSLYTALRHDESLAGIIALSTYLPLADRLDEDVSTENRDIPIFMGHGQMDPLVPLSLAEQGLETLRARHYPVTWKTYPIPHSVSPLEFQDLSAWFGETMGASLDTS
jgi:phospholipase/carboxylesterase